MSRPRGYIEDLKQLIAEKDNEIKELKLIIEAQSNIINDKVRYKCLDLDYIVEESDYMHRFDNTTLESLYFVTLNADPKFVRFFTEESAVNYYASVITDYFKTNDVPVKIHGCFEHTKEGQIHTHFLIAIYDINSYASHVKKLLTHRLHLNYAVKVVIPNMTKQYEGVSGVPGIYKYMAKEGYLFYQYIRGNLIIGRSLANPLDKNVKTSNEQVCLS